MKKYKLACIAIAGIMTMTSCSDFLDTESPSQQTGEVVFENEGMAKSAIMGIYSMMPATYMYGQKMSVNWQGVSDIELASAYQADPSIAGADNGIANYFCDWNLQNTKWEEIFKMAELASTAINGMRKSQKLETSTVMQTYLGEALVLRSLAYFELARRYGDIPYKDDMSNSDLSNVYIGKTDRDSVYTDIIRDMEEAIPLLPWMSSGEYNCERVTKGFAKGLLARIALFAGGWSVRDGNQFSDANVDHYPAGVPGMGDLNGFFIGRSKNWRKYYEIALQQCAELIGAPENPHQLDPDYGNIWKTVCSQGYNTFNENLFEVANGIGYSGDIGTLMGRMMDGNLGYGQRGFGGSYVSSNAYYFYSFDQDDLRRDYACYWAQYRKDDTSKSNKEIMRNDIMNVSLGKWDFFWTDEAYRAIAMTATARTPTGINWILMRYSDVLLMYAEAAYMLDKGLDAVDPVAKISPRQSLEKVRERAFGPGSEKIAEYKNLDFFDAIVNERAWEFGGESIRKLDLVRWGLLDVKIEEMKRAMLFMMDGSKPFQIFGKTFNPGDFPQTVYYKFQEGSNQDRIDWSSVNFYTRRGASPGPEYREIRWFPGNYWERKDEAAAKTLIENSVKVLVCASGLRASYDYSALLGELQWGVQIGDYMNRNINKIGNGVCNYRHLYPIYYEDVYKSDGYLSNSYGY